MKIVTRNYVGRDLVETELPEHLDIAIGEGQQMIALSIRNGRIEIRSLHGRLIVLPQTANMIEVAHAPFSA